jgi:iduronate 2-sulfatase
MAPPMFTPMKLSCLILLCSSFVFTSQAAPKPNVLLICVDDLKPVLGCYGDKLAKTPHLDALAKRSVVFERAFCNQAVCSPSRNALMTGLRPSTLGIYDLATNFRKAAPNAVTVTQHFMQQGYRSEGMGKILHVGHGNTEDAASWSVPHYHAQSISYLLPENKAPNGLTKEEALFSNQSAANLPRGAAYEMADVADDAYPDGKIALEAIRRLRAAKEKPTEPFFLAVGFLRPHLPFNAPKKYWDLFKPEQFPLAERRTPPDGAPSYAPQFGGEIRQYKDIPDQGVLPDDLQRKLIHGYYAATSYMDAQLGKLINALDELKLADNTIIVLWGDHGWHFGDHSIWCKHTNYEEANRIPLMIAAPNLKPNRTAGFVETVDIYPTLADLAGLPAPKELDGKSLVAQMRDPAHVTREFALHCYPRGERIGRALRNQQYRIVEWKTPGAPPNSAEFELYDYLSDPLETKNLAESKPDVLAALRKKLVEAQPEAKPPWGKVANRNREERKAMFAKRDKNGDGSLSREEFLEKQPDPDKAPARFQTFDVDQNGVLSADEFIYSGVLPSKK